MIRPPIDPHRLSHYSFFVLVLLSMSFHSQPAWSETRTIQVSGEGRATAPPDMATLQTGVSTLDESAAAALATNSKVMNQLMAILEKHNIAKKDIQTTQFNIYPEYQHEVNTNRPRLIGYRVSNEVTVHVRNLPELGKVLDSLVQAGSNSISGIRFGLANETGVLDQARAQAMADAKRRASQYADLVGGKLGKVLKISEEPIHTQPPEPFRGRAMAEMAATSVPVASGELEVATQVHVVYELVDP